MFKKKLSPETQNKSFFFSFTRQKTQMACLFELFRGIGDTHTHMGDTLFLYYSSRRIRKKEGFYVHFLTYLIRSIDVRRKRINEREMNSSTFFKEKTTLYNISLVFV